MANFDDLVLPPNTRANQPAAGIAGRIYFVTDENITERDNGSAWVDYSPPAGLTNPMTTQGDVIYGGASGVPTRLAKGTAAQVLAMNAGATAPEWVASSGGGRTFIAEVTPSGVTTVQVATGISGTYKKLIIEYAIRSSQATNGVDGYLQFNADTTAGNYRYTAHRVNSTGSATETGASYLFAVTTIPAASAPADEFGIGVIEIPQYANTGFFKKADIDGSGAYDATPTFLQKFYSALSWKNTAAITQIDISLSAGNFVANSVIRLYGET